MNISKSKPIDKYIPWMFVAFFVVIALVDTVFVTLAVKTQTGLVTEKAYETGLEYNKILKSSESQKLLGWSYDLQIAKDGSIRLVLKDKDGKEIQNAKIDVLCFRTVQDGMDINMNLKETAPGIYEGHPSYPKSGAWKLFITVNANKQTYHINKDIVVMDES